MPTTTLRQAGGRIAAQALARLRLAGIDKILPKQAKRRIANHGDSEHRYPDLWDHPKSFRKGGEPLSDTGSLFNALTGKIELDGNKIKITLVVPASFKYALYHQSGFSTKGPNFIPLTVRAKENATRFKPLVTAFAAARRQVNAMRGTPGFIPALKKERLAQDRMESAGFIEGETYIMAWKGVNVPQRKIFNLPPENVEEIRDAIARALR